MRLFALLLALLLLPTVAPDAAAQNRPPLDPGVRPVTRTYALTNARIVQAPGRIVERATVVVRDGLILAVGPDVTPPFDAEVIAADSLTVYAGFIDALGHAGIPEPKEQDREPVRNPGDPPRDRAGIQPDRDAATLLAPEASSVEALRKLGFAAAHAVPHDGMLPGQSAVILLRGDAPDEMVLRPRTALFAQFDPAQGMYPATPMAILAELRELYRQAAVATEAEALYAQNPDGLARPAYDPALAALTPSLDGRQPVYFRADDVLQAHRALKVAGELGLPLVLAGVKESSMLLEKLEGRDIPVLAALDLPPADTTTADTPAAPIRRIRTYADVEAETAALQARRRDAIALYERNAAALHEAGIPVAFATLGAEPEQIRENLRRIVEAGLSREDALAALTTMPADLLGLDRLLGTVEPGKLANLVVTDGDYFDEDTRVRYVFVEGERFEVEKAGAAEADTAADAAETPVPDVTGTWRWELVMPQDTEGGLLYLSRDGDRLTGTLASDDSAYLVEQATLSEGTLSFRFNAEVGPLLVQLSIEGDTLSGTATTDDGTAFPFTAHRPE